MRVIRKKFGKTTIITSGGLNIDVQQREPDEIIDITNPRKHIKIKKSGGKSIDSDDKYSYTKLIRRK